MPQRVHPIFRNDYLNVTDIPTGYGNFRLTPSDVMAVKLYQNAGTGLQFADRHLLFWQRLGRSVSIYRAARCHGCAAYAARTLFMNGFHNQHNMNIWICGRGNHYFTVLSNSPRPIATQYIHFAPNVFDATDIVIDLWAYNIDRQENGRLNLNMMATTVPNYDLITNQIDIGIFVNYLH